ncbi:type I DNA topoisomerase [Candidatus Hepatobacter penaei]|uniref:type I DNA topoisomerase n=1 Tax=Candidatus Hepatobacter penaei TaxID=1274402 RepID=UPI00155AB4C8|nr:type I DNA topoisomerase [Candidatus Hepatobacter penaei]
MNLVLVESPAKVRSLSRYLGKQFTVMATYGHMRDLPAKSGSVDPSDDFHMTFQVVDKNKSHLDKIEKAAQKTSTLFLATDPDREGEAIAWHVVEHLKTKTLPPTVQRITFNAITKTAVLEALKAPRDIDQHLVDAYLARLGLDYLVGFTLSPLLWRKLPGCRSAGRVQSVALRMISEREYEIERFKPQEYWTLAGLFQKERHDVNASLFMLDGKKLEKFSLTSEKDAQAAVNKAEAPFYTLSSIEKKEVKRHPAPPFMTSTLQQEASRKLGWGATQTMRVAQKLYEGVNGQDGLITYMRTDSNTITDEALTKVRQVIGKTYGQDHVSPSVRVYKKKARNAQEAHEAIRPTNFEAPPHTLKTTLDKDLWALYDLIWRRTMASQMASALFDQVTFVLAHPENTAHFKATGRTCMFRGFLEVYLEDKDPDDEKDEGARTLPPLKEGDKLDLKKLTPSQHFTEPPPRFTEASLIKKMEELGIGRPSTYARILQVLKDRSYVSLEKKQLAPKEKGHVVTSFLTQFFTQYVENNFTAGMEASLDAVSRGDKAWKDLLKEFWDTFKHTVDKTTELKTVDVLEKVETALEEHLFQGKDRTCPTCKKGVMHLRMGKYGPFLGCNAYPECKHMKPLDALDSHTENDAEEDTSFPRSLGEDPHLQKEVTVRRGPYGFYLQWEGDKKPKRVSLPKGLSPQHITLEEATKLGKLPLDLGLHPETKEPITGNIGRFGPYVYYKKKFISIKNIDLLLEERFHEILEIIAKKEQAGKKKDGG